MITLKELEDVYLKLNETDADAKQIFDNLLYNICEGLDNVMKEVYQEVIMIEDPPIDKVQQLFLKLGNFVYFFGSTVEGLGLTSDLAEISMKEVYNNAYNNNLINPTDGKKRTANELATLAEAASLGESVVNDIYKRVYKTMKLKLDSAQSMVSALSKVLSKKMQEMNFSQGFDPTASRILME